MGQSIYNSLTFFEITKMKLTDYIKKYYEDNKAAFARSQEADPQQVSVWVRKGFIVIDHILYSPRRVLKKPEINKCSNEAK